MKRTTQPTSGHLLNALANGTKRERQQAAKELPAGEMVEMIPGFAWGGEVVMIPAGRKRPAFRWADEIEQA